MKALEFISVALDGTVLDETLMRYGAFLQKTLNAPRLQFVHVMPWSVIEKFNKKLQEETEVYKQDFRKSFLLNAEALAVSKPELVFLEGSPSDVLPKHLRRQEISLLLLGRRVLPGASGILPEKLARKSPCPVVFVPEGASPALENLYVGMDFSENAHLALDVALDIGSRLPKAEIHPLHLFRVPKGYAHKGKTGAALHGLMQDMAKEEYEEFMKGIDLRGLTATPHLIDATDQAPGEVLYEATKDENAGMLIVGARGHSELSAFVLGSFTESLIRYGTPIPLLVVKDHKTLGFLETLFKF